MPYLENFELSFEKKTTVIFEISNLKVVKLNNLTKIQKCLNLGRKTSYFGIYGLDFLKRLLYLKLPLLNLSKFEILAKEKTEISEFWTKTSLFWYLLVRLLKKPMFCFLKSEPSNFWKILKIKALKFVSIQNFAKYKNVKIRKQKRFI